jgi:hypothetical protein
VDIYVNGILLVEKEKLILDGNLTTHFLTLRSALNTISYTYVVYPPPSSSHSCPFLIFYILRVYGESVAFDWIGIKGGSEKAVNGATLPYEEIEAEASSYQGTLLGPGRQYPLSPSSLFPPPLPFFFTLPSPLCYCILNE